MKNVKADQLILIKIIRVPVVATKQWRVQQAVLTVQPYRLRHILAFAIKETLRKWKWTAKPTSFGGLASIKWLEVIHAQKHNLWTDRFGWACYINDCDVVKPLLHEISSRVMATSIVCWPLSYCGITPHETSSELLVAATEMLYYCAWNRSFLLDILHRPRFEKFP